MSSKDIAVSVRGLSKCYTINHQEEKHTMASEALLHRLKNPFRRPATEEFWALRGVSFDVNKGDVVGIIGRNGAGKSTLLKILSQITEPTAGEIKLYGRVGSLLEVGTGFHPELTGRENIFLNGAILGMRRKEIEKQFDAIVDFAEIEQFIDTPVKRYSSGMYVRLAFAVAAHLNPEILVVDEVLAVGDMAFQKKCLGKMQDVAESGRTVLFVSHNMGSLANLCSSAVLLEQGQLKNQGAVAEIIAYYIETGREEKGECIWSEKANAPGNHNVRIRAVRIVSNGETTADVKISEDVEVEVEFWNLKEAAKLTSSIHLIDNAGACILATLSSPSANLIKDNWAEKQYPKGLYKSTCVLPKNFLNEGRYSINALILNTINQIEASAHDAVSFTVHETGVMRQEYAGPWIGQIRPRLAWQTEQLQN